MRIRKTIFLIMAALLAAAMLFSVCSCGVTGKGGSGGNSGGSGSDGSEDGGGVTVTVGGETFKLDYETDHGALHYSENIPIMDRGTMGSVRDIHGRSDEGTLFVIRMVYFKDKGIEEVMEGSDNELSQKTMNGIAYTYFEYDDPEMPASKAHTFMYVFDGTTYSISFVSEYDLSSLEEGFFKTVYFEGTID